MKHFYLWILLLTAFALPARAQQLDFWNRCGERFDSTPYPPDSFRVRTLLFPVGSTEVAIIILHFSSSEPGLGGGSEDQVWLEQRQKGAILHAKYLGGISSGEHGIRLPEEQPFEHFFIVQYASEFTGTFYLLDDNGNWASLPGSELTYDKTANTLFTFVPVECGGCPVGKYSMDTRTLVTKSSDGKPGAWEEVENEGELLNTFEGYTWIKWE